MCDLFNYGIEGDSYTLKDGHVTQNEEQQTIMVQNTISFAQVTPFYTFIQSDTKQPDSSC